MFLTMVHLQFKILYTIRDVIKNYEKDSLYHICLWYMSTGKLDTHCSSALACSVQWNQAHGAPEKVQQSSNDCYV